jgi:hypothetical protein
MQPRVMPSRTLKEATDLDALVRTGFWPESLVRSLTTSAMWPLSASALKAVLRTIFFRFGTWWMFV